MAILKTPCDDGVILAGKSGQPCSRSAEPWVLAATILGSSMAFIDGTAVNVALPALQANLGATVTEVQWVVEAYALFLAALLLVGGSLGDRFGRRLVFLIGVAGFALTSAWCGLAPGIGPLIAARAVQGVAAALLVPGSLALLSASIAKERRGRAIGTWSGFAAITAAVGPLMGGWLIDQASWRWVFALNLPIALAVILIALLRVPESRDPQAPRDLDLAGAALATVGLGGVTFGLIESARLGWNDPFVLAALVVGAGALAGFLAVEARVQAPMMPLSLFGSRAFAGANLLTLWLYAALGGVLFFLPFDLIQVHGYKATAAGAALLPFIFLMFLLSRWSGSLVDRFGARRPLIAGPAIAAAGFALFAVPGVGGSYWTTFFPATLVLGFGMAVSVAPLTTTVMSAVEERHAGLASGINNAVSRGAGLLAIAGMGLVMLGFFTRGLDRRLAALDLPPEARQSLQADHTKLAALPIPESLDDSRRAAVRRAIEQSFLDGFRGVMLAAAGLALLASASAWWKIDRRTRAAAILLFVALPTLVNAGTQQSRDPMPKTLTLINATRPTWAEKSVAITETGGLNPEVWGDDTARIREILETPSDQPIYRDGKLVGSLNDNLSADGCRLVGPTYFDYPNPPRRGTLGEAIADSEVALLGVVTDKAYGFYAGDPGQLFQIEPIRSFGYPLSKARYYFFMPVGRFRVGSTEICKTDERYADPPEIGGEVFLFVGKPADRSGVLFHVLNPGDIVTVGPDGSLRLPRQYYSAGEQETTDRASIMRTKSDLLKRIQALRARTVLKNKSPRLHFSPSFSPASSLRIASSSRLIFVSWRLAESIQPRYSRRCEGARLSKVFPAVGCFLSAS